VSGTITGPLANHDGEVGIPAGAARHTTRTIGDMGMITSVDELAARYPSPSERARTKKRDRLDDGLRGALALSPFVLLATSDAAGRCDVSPRGGPPGFVKALDDHRVAIPDLNGNHLLDSLRNILSNPHAGLLVVVPGQHETMRIDGRAHLVDDDDVLDLFADELRRPTLAIVVEIDEVFTHCAKALRRGGLWEPRTWPTLDRPVLLCARYDQLDLDVSLDEYVATNDHKIAADLEADRPA
jgi:hypothetical protein